MCCDADLSTFLRYVDDVADGSCMQGCRDNWLVSVSKLSSLLLERSLDSDSETRLPAVAIFTTLHGVT